VVAVRRIAVIVLAAAVAAAVLPVAPAVGAGGFRFHGSGFGHGVGMSQWGAYGLAKRGWGPTRIVTHFYRGTEVRSDVAFPSRLRVGLAWGLGKVQLTAKGGRVRLSVGAAQPGTPVGEIRRGDTWTVRPGAEGYVVVDADGDRVGGTAWGASGDRLFATYARDGARLQIPQASDGPGAFSYVRGHVEVDRHSCSRRCRLRLILPLRMEEYLYGLSEVPSSWPAAALRAQAIAGRTYASYVVRRSGLRAYCDCHITDGTSDQVYTGAAKELGPDGIRWVAAVDDTAGRVIAYRGELIQAFYSASDGGHTENVEDAWHGGNSAYAIPWLRGVCDPGENTSANPWTDWSRSFTASEVTSRLRSSTGAIGTVTGFRDVRRGVSGRIVTVVVRGERGRATITGPQLRAALGLWDDRVWINSDRNITGPIRRLYDAQMCRPGLPTSKAVDLGHGSRMAFDVGVIYRNDRATVTVWLKGGLLGEYRAVGGHRGRLGLPTTRVREVAAAGGGGCNGCAWASFEGGRIYRKTGVGAFALWGPVLRAYLDEGGPGGHLGAPTSRPSRTDGDGWTATFEGGTITCRSGGGCTVR
jgi:SpoIID/LytB domain protein